MGDRERQLAAVGEAHYRWSQSIADRLPFRPEDNAGARDYNLEFVDLEASAEDQAFFVQSLLGADTSTEGDSPAGAMGEESEMNDGEG